MDNSIQSLDQGKASTLDMAVRFGSNFELTMARKDFLILHIDVLQR